MRSAHSCLVAVVMVLSMNSIFAAQAATRDIAKEEANRQLVLDFYERVFNGHDVEGGVASMADEYRQHNPHIQSGKKAFVAFFKDLFAKNPQARAQVVHVAADGDLVWIHAHIVNDPNDRGFAVVDIFRVKNGRLVEHWDVMQAVPEHSANGNSMF